MGERCGLVCSCDGLQTCGKSDDVVLVSSLCLSSGKTLVWQRNGLRLPGGRLKRTSFCLVCASECVSFLIQNWHQLAAQRNLTRPSSAHSRIVDPSPCHLAYITTIAHRVLSPSASPRPLRRQSTVSQTRPSCWALHRRKPAWISCPVRPCRPPDLS